MISVIIPTYNAEKYINKAINSVLAQTYQDFEILVIDDGSTDNTKEAVNSIPDERIRYIYQENRGPSAARNKGVELSGSEYVAFLDADDFWHPKKLEIQLDVLNKKPDICLVYSNIIMQEEVTGAKFTKTFDNFKTKERLIKSLIITPFNAPSPSTVIAKRESLLKSGLFDPKIKNGEDLDLWLRIAMNTNFYCVKKPLTTAVRPVSGITRSMKPSKIIENHQYILNKFFDETDKEKHFLKYKNAAFAFIHFNIGFYYLFAGNKNNNAPDKNPNYFIILIKKGVRKIINLFISFV